MAWRKLALTAVTAALVLAAYRLGAFDAFGDPAHLRETLLGLGALGWLAYLVAFTVLQPIGVPGVAFMVGASLVWPPAVAIPLSYVACLTSSIVGFVFPRYVARDWVEKRIPAGLRKYDDRLATHGFLTVFAIRMVVWNNPTAHAVLGLSRVRFGSYVAGSAVAYVPLVIAVTLLGGAAFGFLRRLPPERWGEVAVGVGVVALAAWAVTSARKRRGY